MPNMDAGARVQEWREEATHSDGGGLNSHPHRGRFCQINGLTSDNVKEASARAGCQPCGAEISVIVCMQDDDV